MYEQFYIDLCMCQHQRVRESCRRLYQKKLNGEEIYADYKSIMYRCDQVEHISDVSFFDRFVKWKQSQDKGYINQHQYDMIIEKHFKEGDNK